MQHPGEQEITDAQQWRKSKHLVREGFRDLAYIPNGRCAWNATLSALACSAMRAMHSAGLAAPADLNLWVAMHGAPPSARYVELGSSALVLWHGTSAARAKGILEHGLAHRRGVWAATDPAIAHQYTRWRSRAPQAGSSMIAVLIDKTQWDGLAIREAPEMARFHKSIPRENIEYILWSDRIEFVGLRRAKAPKPWGVARFKKRQGRWVPCSKTPVRGGCGT